jgi:hypothetical protein
MAYYIQHTENGAILQGEHKMHSTESISIRYQYSLLIVLVLP